MEEEAKGGDDSQNNDFISLIHFELLELLLKRYFSPLLLYFYYLMMLMWPCISLEREIYRRWILRTSSSQCHNNQVLVPPRKPPDLVKDIYDGQTYDLKTRVDIWTRMDVFPVQYETFTQTFHLKMWFFQFITVITFKWYYVIGRSVALLVWIGIWTKIENLYSSSRPSQMFLKRFGISMEIIHVELDSMYK